MSCVSYVHTHSPGICQCTALGCDPHREVPQTWWSGRSHWRTRGQTSQSPGRPTHTGPWFWKERRAETWCTVPQHMAQPLCGGVCLCDLYTFDPYPYPARKPKLGGLTLSLNMTMGNTRQLPVEGSQWSMAMSHHSWVPLRFKDLSLMRDRVTFWYPSSSPEKKIKTYIYEKHCSRWLYWSTAHLACLLLGTKEG